MSMQHAAQIYDLINVSATRMNDIGFDEFDSAAGPSTIKNANIFFTSSVLGMLSISHVIEEQAARSSAPFRLYASFQKLSRAWVQQERYNAILATGSPVYLYGQPDEPLWQHPRLITVPLEAPLEPPDLRHPDLCHLWFVILDQPQFVSMALVARELPAPSHRARNSRKLIYRNFEGFWTYDRAVITDLVNILEDYNRTVNVLPPDNQAGATLQS